MQFKSLAVATLMALAVAPKCSEAFTTSLAVSRPSLMVTPTSSTSSSTALDGKKKKKGGNSNAYAKSNAQPKQQEKQSVKEARFDAMTRQFMFTMVGLSKTLPDKSKTILKNINLSFYPGAKIGVVGLNGSGKSTMIKIMAGVEKEFDGTARPLPGASIGYLPQEPQLDQFETVQDCLDAAVKSSRDVLEKYNDMSMKLADPDLTEDEMTQTMADLETISDEIEAGNLWELDRIVERAMDSLRLPPNDAVISVLSGGEKRRVSLCQLLLGNHDMLLLDEPTNHLDAESISWLEQFLAQFKGTVVCITHDRYFLENVAGWILELDRGEGIPFEGNYSGWLEAKNNRLTQENKEGTTAAKAVAAELEWIRSNPKAKGNKSKSRLKRYDELLASAAPKEMRNNGQIYIPPGPRLGDVVIDVKDLRKSFGDRLLIDNLEFSFPAAGIVGVIGPNGAGKSTLIKMLMGKDTPDSGEIKIGETVNMIGVGQERMDELNPEKTVFEEISGGMDDIELGTQMINSRAYCSWFGFKSGQQQANVGNLSGGERNRVQLAKVLKTGANMIVLDEPTNDLDVETLRSLEEALLNFAGCAMVVSHDRYFLDRIATHILACEGDSNWHWFEGNYAEYEEDKKKRLGATSIKRIKYAPLINA
uniref:ABC transporter domain-containing protein n=1 Tax=Eucampia antarctica TaxID=49252 RepID=A0A7S2W772_9STRA|mmetsp:Transcript_22780/g.21916  ORF Transcript_22780/g.21916 Transcript_22780/m.21916 type:complete len:647 (+) Transcript_22780:76-2016(+)|eukprot:CAMPEP_0197831642 /NCGR_PEP_ID=MMETSP1437-20131217/11384_1 /TAXON_ID=49252 ORGANISM="Eucampia antarctica, Strain CCMP1452" /NCGR_SAMPLE_ID=MMETSP1437 /ASSEMBLY_ACC=CAM_ASM_001096 /LENGTH=646 /DNA_ID=CAMNT_0043434653 /DNA_START=68 /DNA_END=2008 /DNA_ORIENTATION=+